MAKLVSKTYGDALLELAIEEEKIDIFSEEIDGILNVLNDNPDFGKVINNPRIAIEDKLEFVENVFKTRISDELTGFIKIIVAKGRFAEIDKILQYFSDEVKKLKGIGVAYVTTPSELTDNQKSKVVNKLLETTEFKEMEMHYSVAPELIGGMQIRIGDRVVDSSVHTKIMKMQQELLKVRV
ncbi:MAG: ATP synthase F1 subunit delta [Lachnospiraceae bacterium]|nr:ATP synthase F1 subunit delta [Candidatus Colinaster equi]